MADQTALSRAWHRFRGWPRPAQWTVAVVAVVVLIGVAGGGGEEKRTAADKPATTTQIPAPTSDRPTTTARAVTTLSTAVTTVRGDQQPRSSQLNNMEAFDVCKKFVSARLKAPSTATWRNPLGDQVTYSGRTDRVTVVATVDSENSFGAKIRSSYECTVVAVGDSNWHLDSLTIDGKEA